MKRFKNQMTDRTEEEWRQIINNRIAGVEKWAADKIAELQSEVYNPLPEPKFTESRLRKIERQKKDEEDSRRWAEWEATGEWPEEEVPLMA
jgi:hypothetical protein